MRNKESKNNSLNSPNEEDTHQVKYYSAKNNSITTDIQLHFDIVRIKNELEDISSEDRDHSKSDNSSKFSFFDDKEKSKKKNIKSINSCSEITNRLNIRYMSELLKKISLKRNKTNSPKNNKSFDELHISKGNTETPNDEKINSNNEESNINKLGINIQISENKINQNQNQNSEKSQNFTSTSEN